MKEKTKKEVAEALRIIACIIIFSVVIIVSSFIFSIFLGGFESKRQLAFCISFVSMGTAVYFGLLLTADQSPKDVMKNFVKDFKNADSFIYRVLLGFKGACWIAGALFDILLVVAAVYLFIASLTDALYLGFIPF